MSAPAVPSTVEQIATLPLPDGCDDWELERGEPIAVEERTRGHEEVRETLNYRLHRYLEENPVGRCYTEVGIRFDNYNRRRPDISFYRAERIVAMPYDQVFSLAPDLAIEIVSVSESAADLDRKIRHLRREGTSHFWLVYLRDRTATIRSGDTIRDLAEDDVLELPELLPGFGAPVRSLFPDLNAR
jgi:Uma2 family endonuclease